MSAWRLTLVWVVVATVLLGAALIGRVSMDASRDLEASSVAEGVDLARLQFAAAQNAPIASGAAAAELSRVAERDGVAGVRAQRALLAASGGARSWGAPPYADRIASSPPTAAASLQAEEAFGSPSAPGRVLALLALLGWLGGAAAFIALGFDGAGQLRSGRWRWAPLGIAISFGGWLGAIWVI
ncbi:MAG: hypothetical protein CMH57_06500 [Myxococcales bacterium]|nr:hypothetical protein [Myxococcales bacterium]